MKLSIVTSYMLISYAFVVNSLGRIQQQMCKVQTATGKVRNI